MNELVYVVTLTYSEGETQQEGTNVVGVFANKDDARKALENVFHKSCDRLGIEELNVFSYQDQDSFKLIDIDDSLGSRQWGYNFFGEITETILGREVDIFNDDEEEYIIVNSLAELITIIRTNIEVDGEPTEFVVALNHGAYSRKTITFADEVDENGDNKFEVLNLIDDTTQILSLDELFDQTKTTIGKALQAGALYYVLD